MAARAAGFGCFLPVIGKVDRAVVLVLMLATGMIGFSGPIVVVRKIAGVAISAVGHDRMSHSERKIVCWIRPAAENVKTAE